MTGGEIFLGQSAFLWLSTYGYYVLPILVIVTGPIAGFVGGFLASLGVLNPFAVFLIWYVTTVTTDILFFVLGRRGRGFLLRFRRMKKILSKLEGSKGLPWMQYVEKHYVKLFIFLKISPTVTLSDILAVVGGFIGVDLRRQLLASFVGQMIWSGVFVAAGYYFGGTIQDTDLFISAIAGALGVLAVVYIVYVQFLHVIVVRVFGDVLSALKNLK